MRIPDILISVAETGTGRLLSLDVFRGGTIASMILVNNPGPAATYAPLQHAEWHGWTFTDLVFPFFLWIVGVAMTLSLAKRVARGDDRKHLLMHVARRSAAIFLIGLALNGFPQFDLSTIRIPGVLQRIAICYLCAAAVLLLVRTTRGRLLWTGGLLAVYWMLMTLVPVPGCGPGHFGVDCNFAKWIDGLLLSGHMWAHSRTWDPEGLVSTLPAVATTMAGVFAGQILASARTPAERTAWLFVLGNALMLAGAVLSLFMPVNKQLWTVPYALLTAGIANAVFAACYWLIDIRGWKRFAKPFAVYGVNALAMFVLSGIFAKSISLWRIGDVSFRTMLWTGVYQPLASPVNASLLFALSHVILFWLIAWLFYRLNWIIRV
jgi:predicted acyltransferase